MQVGQYFGRQIGSLFTWFHMDRIKWFSGLSRNLWYLPERFDLLTSVEVLRDFIHKKSYAHSLTWIIPRPLFELFSAWYRRNSPNENRWRCGMFLLLERDGRLQFCWRHKPSVLSRSNTKVRLNYTEIQIESTSALWPRQRKTEAHCMAWQVREHFLFFFELLFLCQWRQLCLNLTSYLSIVAVNFRLPWCSEPIHLSWMQPGEEVELEDFF